jgi:palmitoyltransferase ZDHHC9/14/18
MLYNFLRCYFGDPGIIPRNHYLYLPKDENKTTNFDNNNNKIIHEENTLNNNASNSGTPDSQNSKRIVYMFQPEVEKSNDHNVSGIFVKEEVPENIPSIFKERYCVSCNIVRPPKTSHCSFCDHCVKNFDQ